MKASDDIFLLIKSLTKSEKGYFIKFAARHIPHDRNKSLLLFRTIDAQKEYDETAIRKKLHREKFVRQLPVAKNHLHQLILKSLRNYHVDLSANIKLKDMLKDVEILYGKGLYKQADRIISKSKEIARRHENHPLLLETITWEKKIMLRTLQSGEDYKKLIDARYNEVQMILHQLSVTNKHWKEYINISALIAKEGPARDHGIIKKYDAFIKKSTLNARTALSNEAKFYYYQTYGRYYRAKGDLRKSYIYRKQLVELFESNQQRALEEPHQYVLALNGLLILCNELGKYDKLKNSIGQMRAISTRSINTRILIFVTSYIEETGMYLDTGEFQKGIALLPEIETGLKQFQGKIGRDSLMLFYYNFASLYFGVGNYNAAIEWLNKILNDYSIDVRQDLYCFARILNLIAHYELGNNESLEYFLKSTYRFLLKRNRLYKFETIVLNFLRKILPGITTKQELTAAFQGVKKQLEEISKDHFEKQALKYFDFISWFESKIENRPFGEIVREKHM